MMERIAVTMVVTNWQPTDNGLATSYWRLTTGNHDGKQLLTTNCDYCQLVTDGNRPTTGDWLATDGDDYW